MTSDGDARLPFGRIAFIGFGLIGGSIAMALRARERESRAGSQRPELRAWTPAGHGPAVARASGLLDNAPADPRAALDGADLIVLAGPPLAILAQVQELSGAWRAAVGDALVTDVASTKAAICEAAATSGLRFVGGHPMAGREATGVEAASAALFVDRPWPVIPTTGAAEADVASVEALARATGSRPVRLDAATHDAAVATISHVPLLAAVALVEAITADPAWTRGPAAELAVSGWRDMTRLAAGSPEMGAGILATNASEIAPRLLALRDAIDAWIAELDGDARPDPDRLRGRLERARAALRASAEP
jgi:prephenate dehydrogenase